MFNKIKDSIKSGKKPKKAIADAIADAMMEKKMAHGGMVDAMDPLSMSVEAGGVPKDQSFQMDGEAPRSMYEEQEDGESMPDSISNPATMAKALRNFAMGGLVEASDTPVGNKPMRSDMSADTSEPMSSMPRKPGEAQLTEQAMEALRMKKKSRRFI